MMKKINKKEDSLVIIEKLKYGTHKPKIREILGNEQMGFCAYTETRITSTNKMDIEHFDPTRKDIKSDYYNWYAVNHTWNNKKSDKWDKDAPILHPYHSELELRIYYDEKTGDYHSEIGDAAARNLIELLDLNNSNLRNDRLDYIKELKRFKKMLPDFDTWIKTTKILQFRRAVETVFDIQL